MLYDGEDAREEHWGGLNSSQGAAELWDGEDAAEELYWRQEMQYDDTDDGEYY